MIIILLTIYCIRQTLRHLETEVQSFEDDETEPYSSAPEMGSHIVAAGTIVLLHLEDETDQHGSTAGTQKPILPKQSVIHSCTRLQRSRSGEQGRRRDPLIS